MALTKTEKKLLAKMSTAKWNGIGATGYDGKREANAARKLEERGMVTRFPCDGWYQHRTASGYYTRRYHPQGMIYMVNLTFLTDRK